MFKTLAHLGTVGLLATAAVVGTASQAPADQITELEPTVSSTVVINEVYPRRPATPTDQFVELRNIGHNRVDLNGYELIRCTQAGNVQVILTFGQGLVLAPFGREGQYLLIAPGQIQGVQPDFFAAPNINRNRGVALRTPASTGRVHVDGMAYNQTATPCVEGTAEEFPPLGLSSQRNQVGTDSDRNAVDFASLPISPQNRNSP